tara:strand:+ start:18424 stop:19017 length:594 start_codon:yes stop_codon:yes gene_type:complete
MAKVYEIDGVVPVVHPSSFIHPDAILIGDVVVGRDCYIGPAACLRGDFGAIILGYGVNVQDTCVIHSFPGKTVEILDYGHVGHGAVLHGCVVGKNALVGMNSVVMDGAVIGDCAIVAACSFVKANHSVPASSLVAGVPAKFVRELSEHELDWKAKGTEEYIQLCKRSLATLKPTEALTEIEDGRPSLNLKSSHKPLK